MSTWRDAGDRCPLGELTVGMDACQPCRFFRGASSRPGERGYQHICCNHPRDGSYVERPEVPAVFVEAMRDGGSD